MEGNLLKAVFRQAKLTFSGNRVQERQLAILKEMVSRLRKEDVPYSCGKNQCQYQNDVSSSGSSSDVAPCSYVHVHSSALFSMSVFVIKAGQGLPLHDHPAMTGLLHPLEGSLAITSYERVSTQSDSTILTTLLGTQICTPESPACLLTPHKANFHEVRALDEPAAFFDILAPPYSSCEDPYPQRECHYYNARRYDHDNLYLLTEIPAPSWFYCDQGTYLGPPLE